MIAALLQLHHDVYRGAARLTAQRTQVVRDDAAVRGALRFRHVNTKNLFNLQQCKTELQKKSSSNSLLTGRHQKETIHR